MKKQIVFMILLLASAPGFAQSSAPELESLFTKILSSEAYRAFTNKVTGDLGCGGITEVKRATKDGQSVALMDCQYDPQDGGDPIGYTGIAVINSAAILSFTAEAYPQPD